MVFKDAWEQADWPFRTATHLLGLKQAILLILMVGVTLTTARYSPILLLTIYFLSRTPNSWNTKVTKTFKFSGLVTKCCYTALLLYTVTRIDVIFRYPDRVPLTHFVHRAKKVFSMGAWILWWVFCATGIFRRCNGKMFEHRGSRTSDLQIMIQVFYHCATAALLIKNKKLSLFLAGIFRPFL